MKEEKLIIKIKNEYGNTRYYPVGPDAGLIRCLISPRTTLTRDHLIALRQLGILYTLVDGSPSTVVTDMV